MRPQSTTETFLDSLPNVRCTACKQVQFRGTFYGLVAIRCWKCKTTITFLDGEPVLIQERVRAENEDSGQPAEAILRRAAAEGVRAPTVEEIVDMMQTRWETLARSRPLKRAELAVGLRFDVFVRDRFTCRYCGRNAAEGAVLEADHVMPRSQGGLDELANLVTACWECNRGKSAKGVDDFITSA